MTLGLRVRYFIPTSTCVVSTSLIQAGGTFNERARVTAVSSRDLSWCDSLQNRSRGEIGGRQFRHGSALIQPRNASRGSRNRIILAGSQSRRRELRTILG